MSTFAIAGVTTYTGEFDIDEAPPIDANATYTGFAAGFLSVPNGTTAATFTLPVEGVTAFRAVRLTNNTPVELEIKYNGVTASYGIPPSGIEVKVFPSDADNPLTSIDLVTPAGPSVGAGQIDYAVFWT